MNPLSGNSGSAPRYLKSINQCSTVVVGRIFLCKWLAQSSKEFPLYLGDLFEMYPLRKYIVRGFFGYSVQALEKGTADGVIETKSATMNIFQKIFFSF